MQGVSEKLGTLIEGESLLNDGSAIVVFEVFIGQCLSLLCFHWSVYDVGSGLISFLLVSVVITLVSKIVYVHFYWSVLFFFFFVRFFIGRFRCCCVFSLVNFVVLEVSIGLCLPCCGCRWSVSLAFFAAVVFYPPSDG